MCLILTKVILVFLREQILWEISWIGVARRSCLRQDPNSGNITEICPSKLLASLFDNNRYCNSHTNHRVVTCADESHHLDVNKPYEEAFSLNILVLNTSHRCVLTHIIDQSRAKVKIYQSSYNKLFIIFELTINHIWIYF